MHPRLQPLESRNPLLVERDDLVVDDRLVSTGERFGDLRRLRVLARAVEEVSRLKAHLAAVDEGEGAYPVPFGSVDELRRVEELVVCCLGVRGYFPHQRLVCR